MSSFLRYLTGIKTSVVSSCLKDVRVVMGNEACDLDSAVSALVYAFLLHSLQKDEKKRPTIPLLNIPREDYPLKTEVSYWLRKHSITENHLLFRDDFDLVSGAAGLELTLVDHNVLAAKDKDLEHNVVFILDHHKLERLNPEDVRDGVVIEMVGSCSTLVADEVLKKSPEILDAPAASLLYGTIILDTVNLNHAAKRVTQKDTEICEKLQTSLSPSLDNTILFKELTAAKADISSLTTEQLLRKDVKIAEGDNINIAVASVPMAVKDFLERMDASETLRAHSSKHKYTAVIVMGITIAGEDVKRDIVIFSQADDLKLKMTQYLTDAKEGILQLEPFVTPAGDCVAFRQGNHAASRKVVLPLIREWLSQGAGR